MLNDCIEAAYVQQRIHYKQGRTICTAVGSNEQLVAAAPSAGKGRPHLSVGSFDDLFRAFYHGEQAVREEALIDARGGGAGAEAMYACVLRAARLRAMTARKRCSYFTAVIAHSCVL